MQIDQLVFKKHIDEARGIKGYQIVGDSHAVSIHTHADASVITFYIDGDPHQRERTDPVSEYYPKFTQEVARKVCGILGQSRSSALREMLVSHLESEIFDKTRNIENSRLRREYGFYKEPTLDDERCKFYRLFVFNETKARIAIAIDSDEAVIEMAFLGGLLNGFSKRRAPIEFFRYEGIYRNASDRIIDRLGYYGDKQFRSWAFRNIEREFREFLNECPPQHDAILVNLLTLGFLDTGGQTIHRSESWQWTDWLSPLKELPSRIAIAHIPIPESLPKQFLGWLRTVIHRN